MTELRERQIRLVHELMYQIKVREAMTAPVVCFPSTTTFREIQLCMKQKRFSGTPIVDNDELLGIVSIDDIITAFDRGRMDEPVGRYMSRNVMTIPQNYSVIAASNLFEQYHFGRLPVVEAPNSKKVVGILTHGDIMSHLVMAINAIAERFEDAEGKASHLAPSAKNRWRFELAPDNFDLAGTASAAVKKYLREAGVEPALLRRIAVICYEAEMNVIIHSLGGYLEAQLMEDRVRILVVDEGPGIPDVEKALTPGFTTANEKIRALGFGAGMGLSNIKRCADQFTLRSSMETGTEVEAVVLLTPGAQAGG
jgi:CBS domain-containing protein/anti-sigma regulatory factor (Ser/Thr protein kinase)